MKIRYVELENFRQFYGKQRVNFSTCPEKRVTIIHAENTYGKTTLLNAVLWCFYEYTTAKFENKSDILSWESCKDGIRSCSVSVEIEHMNCVYLLKRTYYGDRKNCDFKGFKIVAGNFEQLPSPSNFISSVVPGEMAKYFFFDGEAAESFSAEKNHAAVATAIKAMLGCSLAEKAVEDLKIIDRKLTSQMPKGSGKDVDDLRGRIENVEAELARLEEEIKLHDAAADNYEANKDRYAEKLRDSLDSKKIYDDRQQKIQEMKEVAASINGARKRIADWIVNDGFAIVARKAAELSFGKLEEASLKGKVPSPFNEDLVTSILENEKCICGRDVAKGSESWTNIISLLESAVKKELQNKMITMRSDVQSIVNVAKRAPQFLSDINSRLVGDISRRDVLEQKINELSKKLVDFKDEEVAKLEKSRQNCANKCQEKRSLSVVCSVRKEDNEATLRLLNASLAKKAKEDLVFNRVLVRKELVKSAVTELNKVLENYQVQARKIVEDKVNSILDAVSHNHRRCRFNENFSLELVRSDGKPCAKSSGESQLLSLVFMAALVEFSASRVNDRAYLLRPGAVAPLVLDSPFGQLDESYQQETAACLPIFAEQVILFLSSTQGNSKVLQVLEPYVGDEYVLLSHSREPQGEKSVTSLQRRGETVVTKFFSSSHDMTEIKRMMHESN